MKILLSFIMLAFWIFCTLILTASVVGILLFISDPYGKSTWMQMGMGIKDAFINQVTK